MGGDDDCHASAKGGNQVADKDDLVRIEADGRLVHDDDLGICEDGVGDPDALAKAFGELANDAVLGAKEVAAFEGVLDGATSLREWDFFNLGSVFEVLAYAEVERQRVVLRHVADAALDEMWIGGNGHPANLGDSGGRSIIAGEDSHGGRLAGSIGTEEADDLPFFNFEADAIYGVDLAEALVELFDFDGMLWGGQFGGLVRCVTKWTLKDGVFSSRNLNDWLFTFLRLQSEEVGRGRKSEL